MAPSIKAVVRDIDKGWKRITSRAEELSKLDSYAKVGILDDGGKGSEDRDGISQGELALLMEFGSEDGKLSARPFVAPVFDKMRNELADNAGKLLGQIVFGKLSVERALGILGALLASRIKLYVTSGPPVPPPNAPSVVRRKEAKRAKNSEGQVRTLVDTARMIGAVTWAVIIKRKL